MDDQQQLRRGLKLALWAVGVDLATGIVARLASTSLIENLASGAPGVDFEATLDTLQTISLGAITASWIAGLFLVLGVRAIRLGTQRRGRALATFALVASALSLGALTAEAIAFALELNNSGTWGVHWEWVSLTGIIASALATVTLLGAVHRVVSLSPVVSVIASVVVVGRAIIPARMIFDRDAFEDLRNDPWTWTAIMLGLAALSLGAVLFQLWRARSSLADSDDESRVPSVPEDWAAAARGIRLVGVAVHARVVIAFVGVLLIVMAALLRSIGLIKLLMLLLPLATAIAAGAVIAGANSFRRIPEPLAARDLSLAALVLLGIGLAGELLGLVSIYRAVGGNAGGAADLDTMVSRDFYLQLLGVVAYVLLLAAMRQVARFLRDDELARRATAVAIWAIAIFGGAAYLRRHLVTGQIESVAAALFLSAAIAIAAIVVVVAYSRVARALAETIEERAGEGGVPGARASYGESGGEGADGDETDA